MDMSRKLKRKFQKIKQQNYLYGYKEQFAFKDAMEEEVAKKITWEFLREDRLW